MASVSYQIANLLEKMTSSDKDFRFMATNDLMTELQKDNIKLDDDSERKVVKMLLRLLEDKNGEVQNLAVKCLGPLVNKVKEYQVETIVDALCSNMISDKEQLRDISSIGLKTVISELPLGSSDLSENVCKRITGKLSSAIEKQEDVSVQLEALDIVADLLSRFGSLLVSFHSTILNALLPQLSSPRQAVRKRTIVALSHLLTSSNNFLYKKLIDHLLEGLTAPKVKNIIRTYIQCIASICRQAGHRFGEQIERVMPLIVQYSNEDDDELREYCLQAFESFVYRCPKEITPHINKIIEICLVYITYDPNYNYDDDDDNTMNDGDMYHHGDGITMETEDDGAGGEEEDGEDEYSDDDDMSWKVRRAGAKCLEAVVSTRRELLPELYKNVSPAIIARFKEREENVKSDIFHAYIALLRQTKPTSSCATPVSALDPDSMEDEECPIALLQQQVPLIVKAIHRQMKEKSIKTRQDCFALLKELIIVLPGALTNNIAALIPGIQYSLGDKNSSSNMKIDALAFVYTLLTTHQPEAFHNYMSALAPPIIAAVSDPFYKITAEALLVLQQLVQVIRPHNGKPVEFDFNSISSEIYYSTLTRLKTADIDQEVKERAIACMGQIIAHLSDTLHDQLPVCLPIFLDRLRNEITRLTTVKALTCIAASPLRVDLEPIMEEAIPILGSFLRKNQRALKLSSLTLLDTLVRSYSSSLHTDLLDKVTAELPALLNESDLHIAQLTLTLLTTIAKLYPVALVNCISDSILPEVLELVKSPLLQGAALNAMLDLFQALVKADIPEIGYKQLLSMLIAPVNQSLLHKQAYHSLAKCAAALTITCQEEEAYQVVEQFIRDVQNSKNDAQHIFALLVIGEIGKHVDLSGIPTLKNVILNSFSSHSEEVKSAASYTLGNIAVGNLPEYLPFILDEIEAQPKRQYLVLHSLKEIITCQSSSSTGVSHLQNFVPLIWQLLYRHCECTEEGTRNVVAECLGKLTLIDPMTLLPRLQESLKSLSPLMRTTTVTAVKFTISDQPQQIDAMLKQCMGSFLVALEDPDLNVRRVALVAFNSAAHNKPMLIRDLLETVLPKLYAETKTKKELIREVEMGPFKHTVDDGLDLRKAAFECMYTLLDSCLDRLDIFEFLQHVESGLRDHYDIKMLTYLMTARLAQLCPTAVLQRLERLVEPLKNTCTMKVKANSVKQEYEKQEELKRSALRAVAALLTIPDADKNPSLSEFMGMIKSAPELRVLFDAIQKDCSGNSVNDVNTMDQS
ncbi:cullin-associated NEDD8-dissociated protein 1 [Chelonus insularis]|uniref:cullin-associated NEDD8-dissociated protein 1 n=1 Tax=Chelonus insularis TaxID=460826 RepID=UPI00158CD2A5|nr:cullin-associated NEDD8-dissociated protein 1 [Chelonus insularis]XP_034943386.1 cullin-associated NEDD8-dissociated protein 1 [Chelonus insularis]